MSNKEQFQEVVASGYQFKGPSIIMGAGKFEGEVIPELFIRIPLKTMNRHGLIAGATGTGKTKTLQIIAEQLSEHGVPSMVMDIKGDLSGLADYGFDTTTGSMLLSLGSHPFDMIGHLFQRYYTSTFARPLTQSAIV